MTKKNKSKEKLKASAVKQLIQNVKDELENNNYQIVLREMKKYILCNVLDL